MYIHVPLLLSLCPSLFLSLSPPLSFTHTHIYLSLSLALSLALSLLPLSPFFLPPFLTLYLQVHSKLAHPTNYHVSAIQKRQVHQYLSSQGTHSAYASHSAPSTNNFGLLGHNLGGHMGTMPPSLNVRKDPMLSGFTTSSPQQQSPVGTFDGVGGSGQGIFSGSPNHPPPPNSLYGGHPQPQTLNIKPDSPIMMNTDNLENVGIPGREK